MGLDIAFNRVKAIAAGLETKTEQRGDEADIAQALKDCTDSCDSYWDIEYVEWLRQTISCIRVPGMAYWVEDVGVDEIVVRANKWGNTYEPLTTWLKAHGIEWTEF